MEENPPININNISLTINYNLDSSEIEFDFHFTKDNINCTSDDIMIKMAELLYLIKHGMLKKQIDEFLSSMNKDLSNIITISIEIFEKNLSNEDNPIMDPREVFNTNIVYDDE